MSRGVNKVIIVGNLGADPETRYTAGGGAICKIRIATSEQWTDKATGQKQEHTEWHRVTLFGKLGEIAGEYLKKGRQVYIEGSIRTSKYNDKDGVEKFSTEIVANDMQMLGGMGERGEGAGPPRERTQRGPSNGPPSSTGPRKAPAADSSFDDDDIPF